MRPVPGRKFLPFPHMESVIFQILSAPLPFNLTSLSFYGVAALTIADTSLTTMHNMIRNIFATPVIALRINRAICTIACSNHKTIFIATPSRTIAITMTE
jgi:hypothetical protein